MPRRTHTKQERGRLLLRTHSDGRVQRSITPPRNGHPGRRSPLSRVQSPSDQSGRYHRSRSPRPRVRSPRDHSGRYRRSYMPLPRIRSPWDSYDSRDLISMDAIREIQSLIAALQAQQALSQQRRAPGHSYHGSETTLHILSTSI